MNSSKPKALLWSESNVGGGHMQVTSQLARSLQERGTEVIVCTSSMDVGHQYDFGASRIVELPQIKGERNNDKCVTPNGKFSAPKQAVLGYIEQVRKRLLGQIDTVDPCIVGNVQPWDAIIESFPIGQWQKIIRQYLLDRQRTLRAILSTESPDIIVTEFWPLGRTNSDVELEPLLAFSANLPNQPVVFSLERDVLLMQEPMFDRRVMNTNQYVDHVLVRGDDSVFTLKDTFDGANNICKPTHYAGYFASPLPQRTSMPEDQREVLVSAGGGYTEQHPELYLAAINAKPNTILAERRWRLLISPTCPEDVFLMIQEQAAHYGTGIVVERNRSSAEFKQLLSDCCMSISQGGYNMTIEAASNVAPAIIVPKINLNLMQNEQTFRARRFQEMGLLTLTDQTTANVTHAFAALINSTVNQTKGHFQLKINGADHAAEYILSKRKKFPAGGKPVR